MKYTFKQCLLTYPEKNLNKFTANTCFEMLGTDIEEFNYAESQTTTSYCENNTMPMLFEDNSKMRIKHYSTDSYNFMIFNNNYTIPNTPPNNPDTLFNKLKLLVKNPKLDKRTQYNTAENIINLNFLLFTNNIDFTIFNK